VNFSDGLINIYFQMQSVAPLVMYMFTLWQVLTGVRGDLKVAPLVVVIVVILVVACGLGEIFVKHTLLLSTFRATFV
jgi:hypothetical protein